MSRKVLWGVHEINCISAMSAMEPESVHALVCDPPYALEGGFMGQRWDRFTGPRAFQEWCMDWATQAHRILVPGGFLLAFGGSRTYHRLACGIEDAGFEVRDSLIWAFGSGFPKALDVGKKDPDYEGWATALKPAYEPVVMARKSLEGTVLENMRKHGTGALNIDRSRIPMSDEDRERIENMGGFGRVSGYVENSVYGKYGASDSAAHDAGRWPANIAMDPAAAAILDAETADLKKAGNMNASQRTASIGYGGSSGTTDEDRNVTYDDSGGASRFFYSAKTSTAERNAGLDGFDPTTINWSSGDANPGSFQNGNPETREKLLNPHPTVKPIALMRWLINMVTPPGGLVYDPFTGSGTTGCAAVLDGFDFLGSELTPEYVPVAKARIRWWAEHRGKDAEAVLAQSAKSTAAREELAAAGQLGLM